MKFKYVNKYKVIGHTNHANRDSISKSVLFIVATCIIITRAYFNAAESLSQY